MNVYRRILRAGNTCAAAGLLSLAMLPVAASAEDAALDKLYGEGVHAYFAGDYTDAHKYLDESIEAGNKDPRCFYFRGLVSWKLGKNDAADVDFKAAATLEGANPDLTTVVSKSLQRVQGGLRMSIEKHRTDARLAAFKAQRTRDAVRYGEERATTRKDLQKQAQPPKKAASDVADKSKPAATDDKAAAEKPTDDLFGDSKPTDEEMPADEKAAGEKAATEDKPADEKPADEKPADEKPAEEKPADESATEEKPAEEKPAEEKPAEEKSAEENPADEKPADAAPAEEKAAEEKPADEKPADAAPAEEKPADGKPAAEAPAEEAKPAEEKPADEKAAEEKPIEEKPAERKQAGKPAAGAKASMSLDKLAGILGKNLGRMGSALGKLAEKAPIPGLPSGIAPGEPRIAEKPAAAGPEGAPKANPFGDDKDAAPGAEEPAAKESAVGEPATEEAVEESPAAKKPAAKPTPKTPAIDDDGGKPEAKEPSKDEVEDLFK